MINFVGMNHNCQVETSAQTEDTGIIPDNSQRIANHSSNVLHTNRIEANSPCLSIREACANSDVKPSSAPCSSKPIIPKQFRLAPSLPGISTKLLSWFSIRQRRAPGTFLALHTLWPAKAISRRTRNPGSKMYDFQGPGSKKQVTLLFLTLTQESFCFQTLAEEFL